MSDELVIYLSSWIKLVFNGLIFDVKQDIPASLDQIILHLQSLFHRCMVTLIYISNTNYIFLPIAYLHCNFLSVYMFSVSIRNASVAWYNNLCRQARYWEKHVLGRYVFLCLCWKQRIYNIKQIIQANRWQSNCYDAALLMCMRYIFVIIIPNLFFVFPVF